jgi:hypothetical protein
MNTPPWDPPSWDEVPPPWDDDEEEDRLVVGDTETLYASGRLPGRTYASRTFAINGEMSRDHGQPARFIYKILQNGEESEITLEGTEWILRETAAGRYQIKLLVAREAARIKSLWIQRVPGPGYSGRVKTLICLDRESAAVLVELLQNLEHIPVEGASSVRVDDVLVRDLFASPTSLVSVYRKDPERFRQLITDDVSARDLIAVSHRRQQLEKFRRLLSDGDFFDEEAARYSGPEAVWQSFFEFNPWILDISLTGQLLTSWNTEKLEQVVVGSSISGAGKRTDSLLRTAGRIRSMVFAEFKTHRTKLLAEPFYRSGCWAPSRHMAGGVAQVQGTVNLTVRDISDRIAELAPDGTEVPGEFTYLIRPRSFLVIGMLSEFVGERGGHDMARFRSFELYRRNLVEPEVITFDELLARAEWLVEAADLET